MPKTSTSEKIIAILDKLPIDEVITEFYTIRDYVGKKIEEHTQLLEEEQKKLQQHGEKINK